MDKQEFLAAQIDEYIDVAPNGLDWKLFAQTKEIPYKKMLDDGVEYEGLRPEFPEDLKKLDGQQITLKGFMFPLQQTDEQTEFLFGPFPLSCPFHYHVGPSLVIEAHATNPISFDFDPITVSGTLELVPRDDEFNTFYRLKNVKQIN